MSVGGIGGGAFSVVHAGQTVDPAARQAQVNAQADLLQALRGVAHGGTVLSGVTASGGFDTYA
ncbi:hypothetical protein [Pilimelia anulata]|nr:hypothetical protein [Pilimelia anulata]